MCFNKEKPKLFLSLIPVSPWKLLPGTKASYSTTFMKVGKQDPTQCFDQNLHLLKCRQSQQKHCNQLQFSCQEATIPSASEGVWEQSLKLTPTKLLWLQLSRWFTAAPAQALPQRAQIWWLISHGNMGLSTDCKTNLHTGSLHNQC